MELQKGKRREEGKGREERTGREGKEHPSFANRSPPLFYERIYAVVDDLS